jgi:hypothetical protein
MTSKQVKPFKFAHRLLRRMRLGYCFFLSHCQVRNGGGKRGNDHQGNSNRRFVNARPAELGQSDGTTAEQILNAGRSLLSPARASRAREPIMLGTAMASQ